MSGNVALQGLLQDGDRRKGGGGPFRFGQSRDQSTELGRVTAYDATTGAYTVAMLASDRATVTGTSYSPVFAFPAGSVYNVDDDVTLLFEIGKERPTIIGGAGTGTVQRYYGVNGFRACHLADE